jgi:carboxyl-terminal processing protease
MFKRASFVVLGFVLYASAGFILIGTSITQLEAKESKKELTRLESWEKLKNIFEVVDALYVDDINFSDAVDKAIIGLISNLDAHSSYLDKSQYKELTIHTQGEFGGLGIQVGTKNGALTVISPIDDTPAFKAGMKSGDIILKIDDKSTINMSLTEAISYMRGKPNTKIKLTCIRKGASKPVIFNITRAIIQLESVKAKKIEDSDLLYIRVSTFDKKVTSAVKLEIKKAKSWAKGIILDLRGNPGGDLEQAIGLSNLFIDKGIIVSQKSKNKRDNVVYKASSFGTFSDIPLVTLVNGGSASASEIVSGALQDHKRSIIIGEKTFGKGSVQLVYPINKYGRAAGRRGTEAIKITIARYYLPSGRTIQAKGVIPDVVVRSGKVSLANKDGFSIKEAELKQHLKMELDKIDTKKSKKEKIKRVGNSKLITKQNILNDLQLKSAIDTLKVITIMERK